jgi:hypothetical protein
MAKFLDWIKQWKESAELKALSEKYGHDAIGSPGAGIRHWERLANLRDGASRQPESKSPKTKPRPKPSWER